MVSPDISKVINWRDQNKNTQSGYSVKKDNTVILLD